MTFTPGRGDIARSGNSGSPPLAGDAPPHTGDLVIDAAVAHLAEASAAPAGRGTVDLDALVAAGEALHASLRGRLDDLGS